tara:strand:+ start:27454 stop:28350 length:897 start_codon:yes stop_codon:yes gene_type:complete
MNAPNTKPLDAMVNRSIGAILMDAGRLTPDKAEQILRLQREENLMFGEAALKLNMLTADDIAFAMSRQFDYPYLRRGDSPVSEAVTAAYDPFSPAVEALRALRSQLMLRWFDKTDSHKCLVVSSPDSGEGRSWLVANLGVVFSQLGERTLIIDADLRKPAQHSLFGLDNRTGLSTILSGRAGVEAVCKVPGLVDLSVLASGPLPPNPQEILSRALLPDFLQQIAPQYDVILIDTPPAARFADANTLTVRAGAALVVSRLNVSRTRAVRAHCAALRDAGASIVGTVLTQADGPTTGRGR